MRHLLVALVCTLALATAAGTAHAKGAPKSGGKGKGQSGSYQGTIVAVTRFNVTIEVANADKNQRMLIATDKNTEVSGGGKHGTLADLAAGQIVSIEVKDNHAKKIDVTGVRKSE